MTDIESSGPIPRDEQVERLRQFILERWPAFAVTASRHQWPSEQERWQEFAFCLFHRVNASAIDATTARTIIDVLARLELLEVATLASLVDDGGRVDLAHDDAVLLQRVMVRLGVAREAVETAIVTLSEAAAWLQRHHDGKVQRYLRAYGEQMLREANQHFNFTRLPAADVGSALTHWLQNALSMPLALREPAMEDLAQAFGLSTGEIVELADELDINVALLDDMIIGTSPPMPAETGPPEPV